MIDHCQKVNDKETPQQEPHTQKQNRAEPLYEDRDDCVINNRNENYLFRSTFNLQMLIMSRNKNEPSGFLTSRHLPCKVLGQNEI